MPSGLLVTLFLSDDEVDVLLEIMRAGGFSTPAGAAACGLYRLAEHLDLNPPIHLFQSRGKDCGR